MNYLGEEPIEAKKKNPLATVILIGIILTIIIICVLLYLLMTMSSNKFGAYLDGQAISTNEDLFIIEETGKVYVSVYDIAKILNYDYHVGEYKQDEQDENKCYVEPIEGKGEATSFFLNSKKISKVAQNSKDDYENYEITEPVKKINGKMYVISDGIEKGFNVDFKYNKDKNNITIYTIEYLIQNWTPKIIEKGYEVAMNDLNNSKAVLYGMFVVKNSQGKIGVIDTNMTELVVPKYNNIQFIENTQEFFVTNSQNKVGILLSSGAQKITPQYDEIKVLDRDYGLYIIKQSSKFGVINNSGLNVIYPEYDAIGIDSSKFQNDVIENQYLLFDNAIPVKYMDKWGLFDKSGNKILDTTYEELGCTNSTVKDRVTNNVLIIPSYEAIVVCKDKLYGLVDSTGKELIPCALTSVYTTVTSGIEDYYMIYNGETRDVIEYLDTYVKQSNTTTQTDTDTNTNTNTENSNSEADTTVQENTNEVTQVNVNNAQ